MGIKPLKLNVGDTIATVSLSWGGAGVLPERYAQAKRQLEQTFGLHVIEAPHALDDAKWLYKNPDVRASDMMWAFRNPDVRAIISNIGGDDTIRMLPYIDWDVIRNNPKIFMGYSDTTVNCHMCHYAGLNSFYGPCMMVQMGEAGGILPYVQQSIRKVLFDNSTIGLVPENRDGFTYEMVDWATPAGQTQVRKMQPTDGWHWIQGTGVVTGKLFGGCMEVIEMIKGTQIWNPDNFRDAIVFFEISEENPTPEQVLYWLRNYGACGILQQMRAIIFGRPKNDNNAKYEQSILQALAEYGLTNMPVLTHFDIGHTDPIMVMPIGCMAKLDCDKHTFEILENAVL